MRLIIQVFLYLVVNGYAIVAEDEIPWSSKLKRDLIDIYYSTSPDNPGHEERVKEKWDKRFPKYKDNISSEELYQYVNSLIEMISHPRENDSFPWTSDLNKKVLRIYHQTRPDWKFQEDRMKKSWKEVLPHLSAEADHLNLRYQATTLLGRIHVKVKKPHFTWNPEINEEILKIHHEIPRNERGRGQKIKETFDLRFPHLKHKVTVSSLRHHIEVLLKRELEHRDKRSYKSRIDWDDEKNAEVIHIYHETDPKSFLHERRMQLCWNRMHPELKHSTPDRLKRHVQKLLARGYEPSGRDMVKARIKFKKILSDGSKHKSKGVIREEDQPSTSYSVRRPEPEINQSHPDEILLTESRTSQFHPNTTRQPEPGTSQSHPDEPIYQPEPQINHFHPDAPIFSPVRHQDFLNDPDMASNIHPPYDFPYLGDYGGDHDQHANWSQSYNQHNQD